MKTSCREHDRVSTVFHVASRSSPAKMSPATRLVSSGNPAVPAKPRTTNGMAKPEECTHRPNNTSPGAELWVFMMMAKANGPRRQTSAPSRGSDWAAILATSTR